MDDRKEFLEKYIVKNTKKNVKNKPKTLENKIRMLVAGMGATMVVMGLSGCKENTRPKVPNTTKPIVLQAENEIDTIKEVKDDFKQKYIKAYNKEYGTDYSVYDAEISVTALEDDMIYKASKDGEEIYVTRGRDQSRTEEILSVNGYDDIELVEECKNVLQIYIGDNVLGTYNIDTGKFAYSGNDLSKLEDEKYTKPTLEKLGIKEEIVNAAASVIISGEAENEQSREKRIDEYEKIVNEEEVR